MFGSDPLTIVHQQHGTLNDILKFAHVPRPFIGFERPQGTVGKAGNLLAVDWREAIDEHTRDQTDVPATLSQRGKGAGAGGRRLLEVGGERPFRVHTSRRALVPRTTHTLPFIRLIWRA